MSSLAIDEAVRASVRDGRSLYSVDAALIDELAPDVIVTQDLCAVCAVSSGELADACLLDAEVISLDPRTLLEVAETVRRLGSRLGASRRGDELATRMLATIAGVAETVHGLPKRRVFFAEWIDPPFCAGHWLPEMIDLAGGVDVLGRAGRPSQPTSWEAVRSAQPELVIVGPCGFDVVQAAARAGQIEFPCRAVAVDGDVYYSRPAPRLADGVRQLAHLIHPERVPDPGLPEIELTTR
jgi:iron complex transport system substrate-binding protein